MAATSAPAPTPAAPCVHLGGPTGDLIDCPSCTGAVKLKAFACDVHGRCTIARRAPGVACCAGCPDREPPPPSAAVTTSSPDHPPITTRDCLYHLHPPAVAGAIWRRRLGMLLSRAALFNGRKVIACTTGAGLESVATVQGLAGPAGFDVVGVGNDPGLRETKTYLELLPAFATDDPSRALFFGHAKGVTRPDNRGVTCHPWSILCHEITLDYWPLVAEQLLRHPITGVFKKVGKGFRESPSAWHYSGTFWWARSAELFRRPWAALLDRHWYGAESSVGRWFAAHEAGCLFGEGRVPELDLYSMDRLKEILVQYVWWRADNEGARTEGVRGCASSA